MPGTRRTPIRRQHTSLITAQAVALFRHALSLRRRGADQQTCRAAERDVDRMLGVKLWQVSIFDFDDILDRDAPPAYMGPRHEDWSRALELRQGLEQADRDLRKQERAARRAKATPPSPPPERPPSLAL